jgi:S-adenosylmethionine decarboxylase
MHLIIDGYGGDPQLLADGSVLERFLDEYPAQIGMTKIAPPAVYRYVGAKPQDWGYSGYVLIAESHISIHTFPARNCLWADVFSCKDFDADSAIEVIKEAFQLNDVQVQLLPRGLDYSEEETATQEPVGA